MQHIVHTDPNNNRSDRSKTIRLILSAFSRFKLATVPKHQMLKESMLAQSNISDQNVQIQLLQSIQRVENHMNQWNCNETTIGTQQILSINNNGKLQIGDNNYTERCTSSRSNSYNGNNENRPKRMSKTIADMMECTDPIDAKTMRIASRYMDKNWRFVFRELGISDPEINQIKEQYINTTSVREIIHQLLLLWKRASDEPTLGKLIKVLWNNEHFKCINELKMLYKQRRHQAQARQPTQTSDTDRSFGSSE